MDALTILVPLQAKKGKLDAAGMSKGEQTNIAEIHNQALMMLGHEVFDAETADGCS